MEPDTALRNAHWKAWFSEMWKQLLSNKNNSWGVPTSSRVPLGSSN